MPMTQPAEKDAARTHSIRILIVDDDNVNANLAKSVLERSGCLVRVASNPVRMLERYARESDSIDVVIVDCFTLSVEIGEAVQRLRNLNPEIKLILFSSGDEVVTRQAMDRYPFDAQIRKPFQAEETLQAIRQLLPVLEMQSF